MQPALEGVGAGTEAKEAAVVKEKSSGCYTEAAEQMRPGRTHELRVGRAAPEVAPASLASLLANGRAMRHPTAHLGRKGDGPYGVKRNYPATH